MRAAQRVAHSDSVEAVRAVAHAAPRIQAAARSSACCAQYAPHRAVHYQRRPKSGQPFLGADHKTVYRAARPTRLCQACRMPRPGFTARYFVADHRALTSNVVPAPGAGAPAHWQLCNSRE
jgi:hypothetical protein